MAGICKSGERTCNETADHLDDQHSAGDHEYDDEPSPVLAGGGHLMAVSVGHVRHLLHAHLSDSQHAIACSESDKSAKGRHQLVGDVGFAYGNPDPVGSEAGEGLAAAYGETVVP